MAETPRELPLVETFVAGGGPAGLNAMLTLQQQGIRSLLAEKRGVGTGRTTNSLITHEAQPNLPMPQLGAMFVYDKDTADLLREAGSEIIEVPEDGWHAAHNGKIEPVGEDGGPISFEFDEAELAALTENVSIAEFLDGSTHFHTYSESDQSAIRAILEADLGDTLDKVGINSMKFDGQTVGGHDAFGIVTGGGFGGLAKSMAEKIPVESKMLGTEVRRIELNPDGSLNFDLGLPPARVVKAEPEATNIREYAAQGRSWTPTRGRAKEVRAIEDRSPAMIKAKSGILAVPFTALKDIKFNDGKGGGDVSLISAMTPEAQKALEMIGTGDIVKVAVMTDGKLVEGQNLSHVAVDVPKSGPIKCVSVWALPPPNYDGKPLEADDQRQTLLMYMGGSQARDFVAFMESVKGDKEVIAKAVATYLHENLGVDPARIISEPKISQWISSQAGRTAYTFIKPGGPADYNPRAAFKESVLPGAELHLAGEAYSEEGATLVGGALQSGEAAARSITAKRKGAVLHLEA